MKIKRSQLKRVIQEELRSILSEISIADQIAADLTDRASGMYSGDLSGGPQNDEQVASCNLVIPHLELIRA